MKVLLAEFMGTMFLVLLGDGVHCNISLNKSGMKGGSPIYLILGWGLAVMIPAFIFGGISGGHFNPAVTIGTAIRGGMSWAMVPSYIIAQMLGGFCGAALLMIIYGDHIKATDDDDVIRGCFCTSPSIRNTGMNFLAEFVMGFILVFALSSIPGEAVSSGISSVLVYSTIVACGASFGGLTGFAMNAARDSSTRFAYQILAPDKGKKNPDWEYGWIPAAAPICGGITAALLWLAVFA